LSYETIPGKNVPIKAWVHGVPLEEKARQQLVNASSLSFIHPHIAVMPDVHWGIGATVGSVIPTKGAIVPAAVGVDLGCGVAAIRLDLTASDLPDNLHAMRSAIEAAVPHGRTNEGQAGDRGAWATPPHTVQLEWMRLAVGWKALYAKYPKLERGATIEQLGTLGTGNHFVEVCLDEEQRVWLMLHSGSRGAGNRIGSHFIARAKEHLGDRLGTLPDKDLAWLDEGTEVFDDYVRAVGWAQDYAATSRRIMLQRALDALAREAGCSHIEIGERALNVHHNYIAKERHFGEDVWVTRKGAVRARPEERGIIPGSMGTKSYIVRGKGNADSFCSCSHGAGRVMSRGEAKKKITLEDHAKATEGVECRKDADVLDESPAAYKAIDDVMAAQSDLVEIVHTLRAVLCVKG
jgi:tRNA-splicing ligase RtcB (3'-phosphate/5'-hydroxy nucleic acid ligase)